MLRHTSNLNPRIALAQVSSMAVTQIQHSLSGLNTRLTALFAHTTPFELIAAMTLILLFRFAGSDWFIQGPVTLLTVVGLLHRPLLKQPNYWFLVITFLVAGNYHERFQIDNHKYVITYWAIAIYCVLYTAKPQQHLAQAARLMVGLIFLFATFWKFVTPDFMDGTFFVYEFLTDERFYNSAAFFANITPDIVLRNNQALHQLLTYDSSLTQVQLYGYAQLLPLAQLMTWWTIIIEGALAIFFLLPTSRWSYQWRSITLLIFLATTYTNAPVIGFGWVLAVMGLAQCKTSDKLMRALFLLSFFLIWVYSMPWSDLSYGLFQIRLPLAR